MRRNAVLTQFSSRFACIDRHDALVSSRSVKENRMLKIPKTSGQDDATTTMIHTSVLNRGPPAVRSPLTCWRMRESYANPQKKVRSGDV